MAAQAKQLIEKIKEQAPRFQNLDKANGSLLDFEQECLFARQQILKNKFTLDTAAKNPNSLQAAILNVAAIGISLNPASQHAYLVPRDNQICLDISYRGLAKLATDSGAIKWARVELVYENDEFEWCGPSREPTHKANPFGDRGEVVGGYCLAKMPDGDLMVETMPVAEINKIRDTSKAFQKGGGPWVNYWGEMAKKTILKRAHKQWPQSPNRRRIDQAVAVLHETEGTRYTIEQHQQFMSLLHDGEALKFYAFRIHVGDETWAALFNSFERGEKTKLKHRARELESEGNKRFRDTVDALSAQVEQGNDLGVKEILEELDEVERLFVTQSAAHEIQDFIENLEGS